MRKKDLLCKQECMWLRDLIDKELLCVTENFVESNEHPVLKLRLENLEAMKIKLNNQINYQPKKRAKDGDKR